MYIYILPFFLSRRDAQFLSLACKDRRRNLAQPTVGYRHIFGPWVINPSHLTSNNIVEFQLQYRQTIEMTPLGHEIKLAGLTLQRTISKRTLVPNIFIYKLCIRPIMIKALISHKTSDKKLLEILN